MTSAQLEHATESLRRVLMPGLGRYSAGQELVVNLDRVWIDAVVLQPPDSMSSTVHRVSAGGAQYSLLLAPAYLPAAQS